MINNATSDPFRSLEPSQRTGFSACWAKHKVEIITGCGLLGASLICVILASVVVATAGSIFVGIGLMAAAAALVIGGAGIATFGLRCPSGTPSFYQTIPSTKFWEETDLTLETAKKRFVADGMPYRIPDLQEEQQRQLHACEKANGKFDIIANQFAEPMRPYIMSLLSQSIYGALSAALTPFLFQQNFLVGSVPQLDYSPIEVNIQSDGSVKISLTQRYPIWLLEETDSYGEYSSQLALYTADSTQNPKPEAKNWYEGRITIRLDSKDPANKSRITVSGEPIPL